MSDQGPRTPDADRSRDEAAKGGTDPKGAAKPAAEPRAAGGVRRLTDADAKGRGGRLARATGEDGGTPASRPLVQNAAIVGGALVGGTSIAEVAGATNLGTALSFGQIAFAIALVYVLIRR